MPGSQLVWVLREDELAQWRSHQGVAPGEVRSYAETKCCLSNEKRSKHVNRDSSEQLGNKTRGESGQGTQKIKA